MREEVHYGEENVYSQIAVAEPEFQYGADAFEAYQQSGKAETETVSEVKVQEIKGKSR